MPAGVATSLCPSNGFKGPLKAWQQPPCPLGGSPWWMIAYISLNNIAWLALSLPPLSALL